MPSHSAKRFISDASSTIVDSNAIRRLDRQQQKTLRNCLHKKYIKSDLKVAKFGYWIKSPTRSILWIVIVGTSFCMLYGWAVGTLVSIALCFCVFLLDWLGDVIFMRNISRVAPAEWLVECFSECQCCPRCGYSLASLLNEPSGIQIRCPECGNVLQIV